MSPGLCDGCGEKVEHRVEVCDADGETIARVCKGRGYHDRPKPQCLRRWVGERAVQCLGCGGDLFHTGRRASPLCKICLKSLQQHAGADAPRRWYLLRTYPSFGSDIPGNRDELGQAFKLAVTGSDAREMFVEPSEEIEVPGWKANSFTSTNTRDLWMHLTEKQAEGVRAFVAAFRTAVAEIAKESHEQGGALLVRLARGEVSIDEFNDGRTTKPRRR